MAIVPLPTGAQVLTKSKKQKEQDFTALINKKTGDCSGKLRLDGVYQNITLRHVYDSFLYAVRTIPPRHNLLDPAGNHTDTIHLGPPPDTNYVYHPLFFFNNGVCGGGDYFLIQNPENYPGIYEKKGYYLEWGSYEICGDTIKAMSFNNYSDYWPEFRIAYFTGIIQNTNTIINWHEVQPYHRRHRPSNPHDLFLDNLEKIPQTLTFLPCPGKSKIDSAKPWINKYRRN